MNGCMVAGLGRGLWRSVAGVVVVIAATGGCGRSGPPPVEREAAVAPMPASVRETLLEGAIAVLGRLDDYDEAAAFTQVFDRINQWSHAERGGSHAERGATSEAEPWRADPLVDTLPKTLLSDDVASSLAADDFDAAIDMPSLRDQRWLADIARQARGSAVDDLDVAEKLFEWTVNGLAIVSDPPGVPTETNAGSRWFLPGEIMLAGRGSAAQRAWIFLQLLRHAGLDGVMLATGADPATARPWIPALVSGGEAYLFETTYGFAVPGPGGAGVATFRQAAADPAILAALSLPERPYPVQAADLRAVALLVAADPFVLAQRMHRLEARLAGVSTVSLSIAPAAVADRAHAAIGGVATVGRGLWAFPWEAFSRRRLPAVQAAAAAELAVMGIAMRLDGGNGSAQRSRVLRPLYAARVREFRGDLDGPDGAKAAYLAARPASSVMQAAVAGLPPPQAAATRRLYEQMKEDATYWLGLLTLAEGDFEAAIDYLDRMLLDAAPDSRWTDAARVALGRALVALGRTDDAIGVLRADTSPQRFGSRIRAARLAAAARESTR